MFKQGNQKAFGLTMSLPEEESEHAEDDDERCWGLGRKTGEVEGESALSGEVASLCSSMETSISFARSCSQDSRSTIKHRNNLDSDNYGSQLQEPEKAKSTMTPQLSVVFGPPLLDCPGSVGQHIWTNSDDAS